MREELERFFTVVADHMRVQWYGQSTMTMVFDNRNFPNILGADFDLATETAKNFGWRLVKHELDTTSVAVIITLI